MKTNIILTACFLAIVGHSIPAHAQDTIRRPWVPYVTFVHEFPNASMEFTFGEYKIHYKGDSVSFYYPDILDAGNRTSSVIQLDDPERTYTCNDVLNATTLSYDSWWGSSITAGPGDTLTYYSHKYSFPHRGAVYSGFDISDTIIYVLEIINKKSGNILTIDTIGTIPFYYDDLKTYTDLPDLRRRKSIQPNDTAIVKHHVFTERELTKHTPITIRWRLLCAKHPQYVLYRRIQDAGFWQSKNDIEYRARIIDKFRKRIEELKKAQSKPKKL